MGRRNSGSPAANKRNNLESVALLHGRFDAATSGHQCAVHFDGDAGQLMTKGTQEVIEVCGFIVEEIGLAVDRNVLDHLLQCVSRLAECGASYPESSSAQATTSAKLKSRFTHSLTEARLILIAP